MRYFHLLAGIILMAAGTGTALAGKPVDANSMGLSKSSVFEVPQPKVYHYGETPPGQSKVLPRAFSGAPPQIPHDIADFLPITSQGNMCLSCHDQPGQWGQKREKGMPTPIPPSHYIDKRSDSDKVAEHPVGARYNCNQCHVPQTNAAPLVENTFPLRRTR